MINWTPEGRMGQFIKVLSPYAPPPPPGAQPPPLWGNEQHVRELFGNRISKFQMTRQFHTNDYFQKAIEFRDYHKANFGPVVAVYHSIGDDLKRVAALDQVLADFTDKWDSGEGGEGAVFEQEYLLVKALRAE